MKKMIFIMLMLLAVALGKAQMLPIEVGDTVPDLRLNMYHYTADSLDLRSLRGKVLLLDFWSVWCSSCIKSFPGLAQLQEDHKDQLFILPVGFDVMLAKPIRNLYRELEGTPQEITLYTALQYPERDSLLMKWFPFYGLPHYVWIDQQGRFMGVSKKKDVTPENIEKAIQGTLVFTKP